jgi:FAD/FMN-containing dehydrogenase
LQQGRHGLTADHFVNLNVVLASGTAVQVNERSHPDLWWAMRGAGHNFGIVTSFESKIWPDNFRNYFVKSYQFDGSSLELLMERINEFNTNGSGDTLDPTWLGSFGLYTMNRTISQTEVGKIDHLAY